MKKEITLEEKEIKHILKEYFKLNDLPTIYFSGGIVNPKKIIMVYFEIPKNKNLGGMN